MSCLAVDLARADEPRERAALRRARPAVRISEIATRVGIGRRAAQTDRVAMAAGTTSSAAIVSFTGRRRRDDFPALPRSVLAHRFVNPRIPEPAVIAPEAA